MKTKLRISSLLMCSVLLPPACSGADAPDVEPSTSGGNAPPESEASVSATTTNESSSGAQTSDESSSETLLPTDTSTAGGDDIVELSNAPMQCPDGNRVFSTFPQGEGEYVATVLSPPSWPFEVTSIGYQMVEDRARCDNRLAHRVLVFPTTTERPTETPSSVRELRVIDIPANPAGERAPLIERELERPLVLEAGEMLVVAIELAVDATLEHSTCLQTCYYYNGEPRSDWAAGAHEPYVWTETWDVLSGGVLTTRALGH